MDNSYKKYLTMLAILSIVTFTVKQYNYAESISNNPIKIIGESNQKIIKPINITNQNIRIKLSDKLNTIIDKNQPSLLNEFPLEQEYISMGYSERAAKILATKTPKQTISIKDTLNAEEQQKMYNALKQRKLLGYYEITKNESDDIHNAENNIYDVGKEYRNLSFTPSIMPSILENEYNYIGYAYDYNYKFYPLNSKSNTLRRVLKNDKNTIIILDEESVINGETHSTEEFITHRISGYPATIEKIKASNDDKTGYHLVVGTEDYDYVIYLINDHMNLEQATDELLRIGEQIVTLNSPDSTLIPNQAQT